ncbi:MAG: YiiX/YebB-like N1pC/P60 family cysteine hydrolase [Bacillota bacterium]|nr:YiiX/YebB-like N1pC/P60 family cysteine hydrolase [Bacillota bacterium]
MMLTYTSPLYAQEDTESYKYTEAQQAVMDNMSQMEQKYLEYGLNAPVVSDTKGPSGRAAIGSWTWRDGVICVTTDGFGTESVNTWHAAIVAPQDAYAVVEAPKAGQPVRLRYNQWYSSTHTIWQIGVKSTTEAQDYNAGLWAGRQVGKPYNMNFWNSYQTNSFYCSQLVWAAYYYTAGVNLNKSDNDIGSAIAIHPGEFVDNSKTAIIYRNK